MNRRGFLQAILATGVAPYVSTMAGVLMPVRAIAAPRLMLTPSPMDHLTDALRYGGQLVGGKTEYFMRREVLRGAKPGEIFFATANDLRRASLEARYTEIYNEVLQEKQA